MSNNKRVALVVGIDGYIHFPELKCCRVSAEAIHTLLIDKNYGVSDKIYSRLIMDEKTNPLTPDKLDKYIKEVVGNLNLGDQLIFFFSGHGAVHNGKLLLCLPNSEDGNWDSFYEFNKLVGVLTTESVNKSIVIIDTCYSATMFESIKDLQGWYQGNIPTGMAFMSATSLHAKQDKKLGKTLFSHYFIKGIKQWDEENDEYILLYDLKNYINKEIEKNHAHKQVAQVRISRESINPIWISLNHSKQIPYLHPVPFTNQKKQIDHILSNNSSSYHLLDGPTGYGKTYLLNELKHRIKEKSWKCIHISVNQQHTLQDLLEYLFKSLNLNTPKQLANQTLDKQALNLVNQLEDFITRDKQTKGFAILVDFDKISISDTISRQLHEFIIKIGKKIIQNQVFFKVTRKSFRVVMAGCYSCKYADLEEIIKYTFGSPIQLELFSYDVVNTITKSYLFDTPNAASLDLRTISAHILYLSGGHPGAMTELLQKFKQSLEVDSFSNNNNITKVINNMINNIPNAINKAIEQVRDSTHLLDIMDKLSPCRRFNHLLIDDFIAHAILPDKLTDNTLNLLDSLTKAYLIKRTEQQFFQNNTTRYLLAQKLKQEEPEAFFTTCQTARDFSIRNIKKGKFNESILAIEWLYQELQLLNQELDINNPKDKKAIENKFFYSVEFCLQTLVEPCKGNLNSAINRIKNLEKTMQTDWEFQFTINYFLREEQYTDIPYQNLRKKIINFKEKQDG